MFPTDMTAAVLPESPIMRLPHQMIVRHFHPSRGRSISSILPSANRAPALPTCPLPFKSSFASSTATTSTNDARRLLELTDRGRVCTGQTEIIVASDDVHLREPDVFEAGLFEAERGLLALGPSGAMLLDVVSILGLAADGVAAGLLVGFTSGGAIAGFLLGLASDGVDTDVLLDLTSAGLDAGVFLGLPPGEVSADVLMDLASGGVDIDLLDLASDWIGTLALCWA